MGSLPARDGAVVLLSGGLDSAIALWWALNHYSRVRAICVDYGQAHRQEISAARQLARLTGIPLEIARLRATWTGVRGESDPFIRGHNALLIGLAAGSIGRDTADIVIGTLDSDPYADCTSEWRDNIAAGLTDPWGGNVRVLAPLAVLSGKSAAVHQGLSMGVPIGLTWSCREPVADRPCGKCRSCSSRIQAITAAVADSALPDELVWAWQRCGGSPDHARVGPLPEELQPLVDELSGVADLPTRRVWRYQGPDGITRFTPWIARISRGLGYRGQHVSVFRVVGTDPERGPWEVLLLPQGGSAVTAEAPTSEAFKSGVLRAIRTPPSAA